MNTNPRSLLPVAADRLRAFGLAVCVLAFGSPGSADAVVSPGHGVRRTSPPPVVELPQAAQQTRAALEADTTVIHLGDPVSLRLRVDHPPGWSVTWPDSFVVSPFEVLGYQAADPVADGDQSWSSAELVVTSFELGELEVPSIPVVITAADGSSDTLRTDPFVIGVESVGLDESGNLRDIRGPLSIDRSWWGVLPWLLAGVLGTAVVVYGRRRWSRPPAPKVITPRAPARPFYVVALEELAALERSMLLEQGQIKRFHIEVSEIIRRYIEGQLEVRALEMTTDEVADGLSQAALGQGITKSFQAFLARCDLVKFAKLRPADDDSRAMIDRARTLIAKTSGREGGSTAAGREHHSPDPAPGTVNDKAGLSVSRHRRAEAPDPAPGTVNDKEP